MLFTLRLPVRFGDCDPAGFVYYPVLFHYFHVGMEEFFAQRCGVKYAALMAEQRLGFPTVKVQTEFVAPLMYGDELDLTVTVAAVGRSSVTLNYRIVRVRDEAECALSSQVHVCMDLDSRRAATIPAALRNAFAAGE